MITTSLSCVSGEISRFIAGGSEWTLRGAGFHGSITASLSMSWKIRHDIGVLSNRRQNREIRPGARLELLPDPQLTRSPKPTRNIPSILGVRAAADGRHGRLRTRVGALLQRPSYARRDDATNVGGKYIDEAEFKSFLGCFSGG